MSENDYKERVLKVLYKSFDEVNEALPEDKKIKNSPETVLLGELGVIDSLGLTILIVNIEKHIEDEFGEVITLVDAGTMSLESTPFRKVDVVADYIVSLLEEKSRG